MLVKEIEQLLFCENFDEIINNLSSIENLSEENQLFLGIAYYKTDKFELAESIFSNLYETSPTSEITTYLIITKIKLNLILDALSIYESLCKTELPSIIEYINKEEYQLALNLTLFLKSIPMDMPIKETQSESLIDLANAYDFSKLSLSLAEKVKLNKNN